MSDPARGPDFDTRVKLAVYAHVAESTRVPAVEDVAARMGEPVRAIAEAFTRLRAGRVLFLEPDGRTIRMAPPFSGVPTPHVARVKGKSYFANCAWDVLGIPAALHAPGEASSRCGRTGEPIVLRVGEKGPEPEPCVVHFAMPAAHWWRDLVFT
jgi:Alkylmercury lyase